MEFNFTLKFQVSRRGDCAEQPGLARTLSAMGVRLVWQRRGRLRLEFVSEARDARLAMREAVAAVHRAMPWAVLSEAAPDYIGLTGIARHFGLSRQALRKLMLSRAGRFPAPVHEVHTTVWHLAEVLEWLDIMRIYRIDVRLLEIARAAQAINLALDARRMRAVRRDTIRLIDLPRELEALLRKAGWPYDTLRP